MDRINLFVGGVEMIRNNSGTMRHMESGAVLKDIGKYERVVRSEDKSSGVCDIYDTMEMEYGEDYMDTT